MEIKVYLNDSNNIHANSINRLREFGWLSHEIVPEYLPGSELSQFQEYISGINISKFASTIEQNQKKVIIIDEPFTSGRFVSLENEVIFLSLKDLPDSIHPVIVIALCIEKWFFANEIICDNNNCVFGSDIEKLDAILCENCETHLGEIDKSDTAVRILLLLSLKNKPEAKINDLLNQPIGQSIFELDLNSQSPLTKVCASEYIIDNFALPGEEKRLWLKKSSKEIRSFKESLKGGYTCQQQPLFKYPTIIAARRWNSWTPNQPEIMGSDELTIPDNKVGGGYLVSNGKFNLAIDPGYGFHRIMYITHGVTVMDLDAVIVTHDHPDHSSDLPNILSLRFEHRTECPPLRVMLNPSAYFLYKNTLRYYSILIENGTPTKLSNNSRVKFPNLEIKAMDMYHDEIFHHLHSSIKDKVGNSNPIGLKVNGVSLQGEKFQFAFPGDTSFPDSINNKGDIKSIANFFKDSDIMSIHLGSIEEAWAEEDAVRASSIKYGDRRHLGITGAAKFINLIEPKLTIVTEFGEELNPMLAAP